MLFVAGGEEGGEVEVVGIVPDFVVPVADLLDDIGLVLTEVEFLVGGETGECEIG